MNQNKPLALQPTNLSKPNENTSKPIASKPETELTKRVQPNVPASSFNITVKASGVPIPITKIPKPEGASNISTSSNIPAPPTRPFQQTSAPPVSSTHSLQPSVPGPQVPGRGRLQTGYS